MTEQAYFHSVAQKDAFNELEVEEFEVVATLDSHTSDICQGMDGQHFPMSQYEPGVTAPPFHVWCRSVTVPYFEDNFTGERAARDADGNTYYVPDDMTYKEWKKSMVDGDTKGLTNSTKYGNIDLQFFASKEKQFGKKIGKHAQDFGLDPSKESDRNTIRTIIDDIVANAEEVRIGFWRGQANDVLFHIRGEDVVITDQNNEFITILKGGINNGRVKNARIK
jgi:hypothetical protein